jgi:hypothetical protein
MTAMLLVLVPVIALGFVLPAPLHQLISQAAELIGGIG